MDRENLKRLQQFDESNLPDLDVVVLGALELFVEADLPVVDLDQFAHPLVLGSGNAEVTGRILFREQDAIYADESTYRAKLRRSRSGIKNAIIISASGKKHAVSIANNLADEGLTVWLFTNNPQAPAAQYVVPERTIVFPKNREPYTYNTSTYMSMLLCKYDEAPQSIHTFIKAEVEECIPNNFSDYDAFYFILPPEQIGLRELFLTKFDELFGPKVSGRVFTFEQTKHAKTVIPSERELFVSFGVENEVFGAAKNRLHIPLPKTGLGPAAMMAIGYFVIGHIQKQHPPYFKDSIAAYTKEASLLFGQTLKPIVE